MAGGWPWLRSFPFGTGFDNGNLSKLVAASSLRADKRSLLFAFRGTVQWSKPSRRLLAETEVAHRAHWTAVAERLMAHAPRALDGVHSRGVLVMIRTDTVWSGH